MGKIRLGPTQRAIVEYLLKMGGAASSWRIAVEVCGGFPTVSQPALWRLVERGLVKHVESGRVFDGESLTPEEEVRLKTAQARQPRAYTFWVLADKLVNALERGGER
jgi:hypothetical protein